MLVISTAGAVAAGICHVGHESNPDHVIRNASFNGVVGNNIPITDEYSKEFKSIFGGFYTRNIEDSLMFIHKVLLRSKTNNIESIPYFSHNDALLSGPYSIRSGNARITFVASAEDDPLPINSELTKIARNSG